MEAIWSVRWPRASIDPVLGKARSRGDLEQGAHAQRGEKGEQGKEQTEGELLLKSLELMFH